MGTHVSAQGPHVTRVYFGFDIRGVQRAVSSAQLAVSDFSGPNCPNRALSAQPVTEFTNTNNWANPPTPTGPATPGVWVIASCPVVPIGVTFDVTAALDAALAAQQTQLWLEVRVPEDHESDPTYGKGLFQSSYKLNVELVNTPPATPTTIVNNGSTLCSADTYYTGTNLSISADQTDADRNPADRLTSEFQYWPVSDPTSVTPVAQSGTISGGDGVSGAGLIRVGTLADGAYAWHARTYDQRAYSDWSAACPFAVDKTAPNAPTVSSSEYPENPPAPTGGVGRTGTFVFTANGSDDVTMFRYGTSRTSISERAPADQLGGSATIQWVPSQAGEQSLFVVAYDRAGNPSPVREYTINVLSYGVSAWSIGQAPDPAGSRGVVVTWHFETQVGNGLSQIAYSIDGDAEQVVAIGPDGVVETAAPPLRPGEHTLAYSGRDSAGVSHFDWSTTFYAVDEPAVTSDGVYPIEGAGGGVGVEGVFTVEPFLAADVQSVTYFTSRDATRVVVPVDADGKARIHWTPAESGWTYFYVIVDYTDGTTSTWHGFSVTVNG